MPIHYGSLHKAGIYTETSLPTQRLQAEAAKLGIGVELHSPGVWFETH